MKYLITESQLDKVIFKYLDIKDFYILNRPTSVQFFSSRKSIDDGEYSLITYDRNDGECFISSDLASEIGSVFSLHPDNALSIISDWVENKLDVTVKYYTSDFGAD
jgi:hypothetical protein